MYLYIYTSLLSYRIWRVSDTSTRGCQRGGISKINIFISLEYLSRLIKAGYLYMYIYVFIYIFMHHSYHIGYEEYLIQVLEAVSGGKSKINIFVSLGYLSGLIKTEYQYMYIYIHIYIYTPLLSYRIWRVSYTSTRGYQWGDIENKYICIIRIFIRIN
jgi:hypothetical protein